MQERAGARELAERVGRRVIRSFMPDQHRTFFAELPFVILGSLDALARPWASIRVGPPGFMRSPDPHRLTIAATALPGDPSSATLVRGAPVGVLGIQPETRRRNRMNGKVIEAGEGGLTIGVEQSFGNCPRYIQARAARFVADAAAEPASVRREGRRLSAAAADLVRAADTFYIATASPRAGGANPVEGADVNHRGGRPRFVDLRQENGGTILVAPDFAGNAAFSTFGNLHLNPRAGLLFIDHAAGHVLMLTGEARVVWDAPEVRAFAGAERLLSFRVSEGVFLAAVLPLRWTDAQPAPQLAATGSWGAVQAAESDRHPLRWRPFVVTAVEDESASARSFHLVPQDGTAPAPHLPGQFLPIAVALPGQPQPLRRTYTISNAADGRGYRLTVKRNARSGPDSVSAWLHDHAKVGTVIEAAAPRGSFVPDTASDRPIVLLSAGIGVTPMIAVLEALTGTGMSHRQPQPEREIIFIHCTGHGGEHVFSGHLRRLAQGNPNLTVHVRYSRPRPVDLPGRDYDSAGRIDGVLLSSLLPPGDCDIHLCGPGGFMRTAHALLVGLGVPEQRIHAEAFGPASLPHPVATPGEATGNATPVAAADITFRRSERRVSWAGSEGSLLDLAETVGIDAPWSCRQAVCGTCAVRIVQGAVAYRDEPTARPGPGEALLCTAVPASPVLVLDL